MDDLSVSVTDPCIYADSNGKDVATASGVAVTGGADVAVAAGGVDVAAGVGVALAAATTVGVLRCVPHAISAIAKVNGMNRVMNGWIFFMMHCVV